MAQTVSAFSEQNELLRTYLFHCCLLVLKMLLMSLLTARQRLKHKAFANPEDGARDKVKPRIEENVERVRRAHLNDLENIPIFLVASFAYILTNPSVTAVTVLFRAFTAARLAHTFVYAIYVVPQPARVASFLIGLSITAYMAVQGVVYFF